MHRVRVTCNLCGGESQVEPGQTMAACSYCGAALALGSARGPEHLILPHKRDNKAAEEALQSFLIEQGRKGPTKMQTEFSFIPFSLVEDADGKTTVAPASRHGAPPGGNPYPPAGEYHFFDESRAAGEKIVRAENIQQEAATLVHLPTYRIRYETGTWRGSAAVIGESWQVIAEKLPPEKPRAIHMGILAGTAGLFIAYFALGRIAPSFFSRLVLIAAASSVGYALFNLREKVARQG